VCVLEIVRPGMEDSESAEKQENTGIGPASACRGQRRRLVQNGAIRTELTRAASCAGLTRASIFLAKRFLRRSMDCRVKRGNDSGGVVPAKAGTHNHRQRLWVPALATLGRDDDCLVRAKHQLAAVRNRRRGNFIVLGLLFTMTFATPTCRASEAHITPICHPRCGTIRLCHHPSSSCGTIRRHPTCQHPSS
jgi:hypothetical protein